MPQEIIIINAKPEPLHINELNFKNSKVSVQIIHAKLAYPGRARNLGILYSTNDLIGFLDTHTIPSTNWLKEALRILTDSSIDLVWGQTIYESNSYFAKVCCAAAYGFSPLESLPGTIFRRTLITKSGLLLGSVRAGEDVDWKLRIKLHNIQTLRNPSFMNYVKLQELTFRDIFLKWVNYSYHASYLPIYKNYFGIYFYLFSIIVFFIVFNWNSIFAQWNETSIFYIANITKISLLILISLYLIFRGILLPLKKKTPISFLMPLNFILIACFSFFLDLAKIIGIFLAKFKVFHNKQL